MIKTNFCDYENANCTLLNSRNDLLENKTVCFLTV